MSEPRQCRCDLPHFVEVGCPEHDHRTVRQPASEPASELGANLLGSSRQPDAVLARFIEAASPLTEWDFAALQHDYHGYRLVPISDVERLIGQIAHLRAALAAAHGDTP